MRRIKELDTRRQKIEGGPDRPHTGMRGQGSVLDTVTVSTYEGRFRSKNDVRGLASHISPWLGAARLIINERSFIGCGTYRCDVRGDKERSKRRKRKKKVGRARCKAACVCVC